MKLSEARNSIKGRGLKACVPLLLFVLSAIPFDIPLPIPSPTAVSASVPMKFTYQGNLRQAGFLVNGNKNIIFRIYDSSTPAAALLWTSAAMDVHFSTGVFRVTLEPVITDWETGSLWLELEVGGTKLSPREELTSSPYSVNSLLISGKRYTTAASAPTATATGDLWMDTISNTLKFWNGSVWILTSGSGIPGIHAFTHGSGASDPITGLPGHTVTGAITFDSIGELRASGLVEGIRITTHTTIVGTLNSAANLSIGGAGYNVAFASAVSAGWLYGNGAGLSELNASSLTTGFIGAGRIAPNTIVNSHITDGVITKEKLNQSSCADGEILKWSNTTAKWECALDNYSASGAETDPISVHLQSSLQVGATFYVSSGTVNNLTVNTGLDVYGWARLRGAPAYEGLTVNAFGNTGIGSAGALDTRLEIKGTDAQAYSLTVATGTVRQMVVTSVGDVGVGTATPAARMEVTGLENPGGYIMVLNSGPKRAAWLRNK